MPWAIFNRPSIQLGALQGYIRANEPSIVASSHHPYLGAAQSIGLDAYRILSEDSWAGEALYSSLLFPEMKEQARSVFHTSLGKKKSAALSDFDLLRAQLDNHLNNWLDCNDFSRTSLAGFTVCFSQLPATLLAARRLKKRYPDMQVVLGGSTCVPEVGYSLLRTFPEIDFVITGEGEQPLLELCRFLMGRPGDPGPGVLCHGDFTGAAPRPSVLSQDQEIPDLNVLPVPDYADYFTELKQSGLAFIPQLPVEFSRGCWWNKCAFCNLNLQWCGYRYKEGGRMRDEVEILANKYRCLDFAFTDNALPPGKAGRFFGAMRDEGRDFRFFAEIRASNKPDQYAIYRRGGLDSVQIGIEAFSDSLLQRMNKGTSVIDNLAAMKQCAAAGIRLDGNLILEFPGSTDEEALETLRVIEFAMPFRPLSGASFFLGHGSPVWKDPASYGIRSIRHHPYNRKLFPAEVLSRLELLIKQGTGDRRRQRILWRPVRKRLQEWRDFHAARSSDAPALSYRDGGDFIIIRQEIPGQPVQQHRLAGMSARIYLACDQPVAIKTLLRAFKSVTEKALRAFLADLEGKKLLFSNEETYLALAVRSQERSQAKQ